MRDQETDLPDFRRLFMEKLCMSGKVSAPHSCDIRPSLNRITISIARKDDSVVGEKSYIVACLSRKALCNCGETRHFDSGGSWF